MVGHICAEHADGGGALAAQTRTQAQAVASAESAAEREREKLRAMVEIITRIRCANMSSLSVRLFLLK